MNSGPFFVEKRFFINIPVMLGTLKSPKQNMAEESIQNNESLQDGDYNQHYNAFIHLAAHDLQSPLRKLSVLTEKLTSKFQYVQDKEVEQYKNRINACIAEMKSLVEGFTELAVAIPGNMQPGSCDLDEIIKKLVQENASPVDRIEVEFTGDLPVIEGDKTQLRMAFKKILENAWKFQHAEQENKITIKCGALGEKEKKQFELNEEDVYYKIIVADNGVGFDNAEAERIFHPMVRLHGKSEFPGNGLGLALVKKIIENHKGVVSAEASPGKGTRIMLILPKNHN